MNKKKLLNTFNIYRSVIILIVIGIIASILSPNFLSLVNISNVIKQVAIAGIIACGMTFVILTGGIDLSVGSIVGLVGVLTAGIMAKTNNLVLSLFVGLIVGLLCGALNGLLISYFRIPAFIATLGTMLAYRGCVLVYTEGSPIPSRNPSFLFIGKGTIAGIPVPILILLALFLIAYYILQNTKFGREVYAIGGNKEAARLSGINVKSVEFRVYLLNGLLAAIASIVLISRLGSAQSTSGTGIEMDAIAAVILGGTSLSGGSGFILPTAIGALIMGIIDNVLTLLNFNPHATSIVKGIVIIIAVLLDRKVQDLSFKENERK